MAIGPLGHWPKTYRKVNKGQLKSPAAGRNPPGLGPSESSGHRWIPTHWRREGPATPAMDFWTQKRVAESESLYIWVCLKIEYIPNEIAIE